MSNKVAKWKKWIEEISHDCANVLLSKEMYLDLHKMIGKHPKMQQADYFHEYMEDTYVSHVLMMVRKHLKFGRDSISLAALAKDMSENQSSLPNSQYSGSLVEDLERFERAARRLESFADRVVAHHDSREPSYTPTHSDVTEAIDAMDRLCVECCSALGVYSGESCKPTVQYGWLMIFREMGIET